MPALRASARALDEWAAPRRWLSYWFGAAGGVGDAGCGGAFAGAGLAGAALGGAAFAGAGFSVTLTPREAF